MTSNSWCKFCLPITNNICNIADDNCSFSPNSGSRQEMECCGPRGEPCCIDCYYCLTPFTLVFDILCFPCNMSDNYSEYKRKSNIQSRSI
jgi:hypothetical protein